MTMRCRNGEPHTHETAAESKACWLGEFGHARELGQAYRDNLARKLHILPPEKAEGFYRLAGTVYKVQVALHGSGQAYAKRWDTETLAWEMAPGMVRQLSLNDRMTLDEAKAWGKLYGQCIKCGRTLTDEASIEAGIGPKCAESF